MLTVNNELLFTAICTYACQLAISQISCSIHAMLYSSKSTKDTAHQGIFYSSGWPRGYKNEGAHCYIMLTLRKGNAIRFPIMDLDLRKANENCDGGSDYFQIRG